MAKESHFIRSSQNQCIILIKYERENTKLIECLVELETKSRGKDLEAESTVIVPRFAHSNDDQNTEVLDSSRMMVKLFLSMIES